MIEEAMIQLAKVGSKMGFHLLQSE